jgi:hypothetical protein
MRRASCSSKFEYRADRLLKLPRPVVGGVTGGACRTCAPDPPSQDAIVRQRLHPLRERATVRGRDDESGMPIVDTSTNLTSCTSRHDWQLARHRLFDDMSERVPERREHEDVGRSIDASKFVTLPKASEYNVQIFRVTPRSQSVLLRTISR